MLTPSVQADLEKILASDLGQLAKWQKIQKKLLDSDLAWYTVLSCDQLAVHPCNRGGSGVQPFEVHKKGEMIVKNGGDLGLLASSVCFELSPAEAKRQEQMHFNQALVNASDGLLHFSGKEKFGTVAKSHTSQFVKAILHGCKTPGSLGVNGCLCKETLCRTDDQLKHMVEVGWPWLIVSFKVEEALPSLPSLATLACNSTNSNFEACGELELMSHLTLEAARHGSGMDWDAVSCSICTGGSVAAYAKSIGQYVKLYSGGPGSPLVHFLVAFAKSYAAKVTLGQEFVQGVVHTQFLQTNLLPFTRLALFTANLASPENKVIDGYGRLLSRGDIDRMKQKKLLPEVLKMEAMLENAWQESADLDESLKARIFGKLCVRSCLTVLGKGKQGPESKEHTLEQCKNLFIVDKGTVNAERLQPDSKAPALPGVKDSKPVPCLIKQIVCALFFLRNFFCWWSHLATQNS